jgi:hypothetical protein
MAEQKKDPGFLVTLLVSKNLSGIACLELTNQDECLHGLNHDWLDFLLIGALPVAIEVEIFWSKRC